MSNPHPLSPGKAVAIGHLIVNAPTILFLTAGAVFGRKYFGSPELGILVAVIPAWLWWSVVVPRWRLWALSRGADSQRLERLGVRTLLLWPKGSFLARTELPPTDRKR